jgi:outer membrane protein TolC
MTINLIQVVLFIESNGGVMPLLTEQKTCALYLSKTFAFSWMCVSLLIGQSHANTGRETNEPLMTLLTWVWNHDGQLQQLEAEQEALTTRATAADSLPNLMMSVDLNNVAVEGLDFNQEPMSQLRFGFAQTFPRGDSRSLNNQYHNQQSQVMAWQYQYRRMILTEQVLTSLLQIQKIHDDLSINRQQRAAISDLLQWLESAYKSAFGGVQQQHLIQAELELLSNQDQQQASHQALEVELAALKALLSPKTPLPGDFAGWLSAIEVNIEPSVALENEHWQSLMVHPSIEAEGQQVAAAQTQVNLAEQQKKSAFTLRGGYGYRDDGPNGLGRDDLISVGFSMDLPRFNQRQTSELVKSRTAELAAAEAGRTALIQQHHSRQKTLRKHVNGLIQRIDLYANELVPQLGHLAETEMNAYTNESARFSDVLRAQLRWYEARSQLKKLKTEAAVKTIQLYSLTASGAIDLLHSLKLTGAYHEH